MRQQTFEKKKKKKKKKDDNSCCMCTANRVYQHRPLLLPLPLHVCLLHHRPLLLRRCSYCWPARPLQSAWKLPVSFRHRGSSLLPDPSCRDDDVSTLIFLYHNHPSTTTSTVLNLHFIFNPAQSPLHPQPTQPTLYPQSSN